MTGWGGLSLQKPIYPYVQEHSGRISELVYWDSFAWSSSIGMRTSRCPALEFAPEVPSPPSDREVTMGDNSDSVVACQHATHEINGGFETSWAIAQEPDHKLVLKVLGAFTIPHSDNYYPVPHLP